MESNQIIEISDFDFLKGKLTQTKALNSLEKLIRHNGVVMTFYKMIESFPPGLAVQVERISSCRSEKEYVEKLCIGDMMCTYKAEATYYEYLGNGGRKYSEYLEEVKGIKKHNENIKEREREENLEKEIEEHRREHQARILLALLHTEERYIQLYIYPYIQLLEGYKKERQTKYIRDEIAYYENLIPIHNKIYKEIHERTNRLYSLSGDSYKKLFTYKIGDDVILNREGKDFITSIEDIYESKYGYNTYRVKKVEGIYNIYCGYYDLLPINKDKA